MAGEPTLQYGDDSADGWVEFFQDLLVRSGWPCGKDGTDGIDGHFGAHTLKAVKAFQAQYELQSRNGVVGNETWSVLRGEDEADAPDTGLNHAARGFVERGTKVRFSSYARFESADGSLTIGAYSVGPRTRRTGRSTCSSTSRIRPATSTRWKPSTGRTATSSGS